MFKELENVVVLSLWIVFPGQKTDGILIRPRY